MLLAIAIQGTLPFGRRYAPLPQRLLFGLGGAAFMVPATIGIDLGGAAFMFPATIWVDLAGLAATLLALALLRFAPAPAERAEPPLDAGQ